MRFDIKYKDVPVMELGDNTYLRCREALPCCVCGEPTHFCEIYYEARFCSEECERKFTDSIDWRDQDFDETQSDRVEVTGNVHD